MITTKQRAVLRKMVHTLEPAVYIGKNGLTEPVLKEMELALDAHELVKVKVQDNCLEDLRSLAHQSAEQIGAEVVQVIGRKFSLYRPSEKKLIVLK
ncbi:MAG: ribosome assembly RNA-binding protein YhbY [Anaerovoracaceae bacterium]